MAVGGTSPVGNGAPEGRANGGSVWVTVVSGFLGSGKTTMIRSLLPSLVGDGVALLVNDFGEVGIDAAVLGSAGADVVELSGGCVCCAMRGDLARAMHDAIEARPGLHTVIVEASGIAEPAPLVEQLLTTRFPRPLVLDALVSVIDCANFDRNLDRAAVAYDQIVHADVLVLNKLDQVSGEDAAAIEAGVRTLNSTASLVRAKHGEVPVELIVGGPRSTAPERLRQAPDPSRRTSRGAEEFETVTLSLDGPVDPAGFRRWVDADLADLDRGKGFVELAGAPSPTTFHLVGGRWSLVDEPAAQSRAGGTTIVAIGRRLDRDLLQAGLAGAKASAT